MSAPNLAAIFTPNILKPLDEHGAVTVGQLELQNHAICVSLVEFLIENFDKIGSAPPHIVRLANEYESEDEAKDVYLAQVCGQRSWWK